MLTDEELDRQVKTISVLGDIVREKVERGKEFREGRGVEWCKRCCRVVREGSVGVVIRFENFEWGE